MHPLLNQSSLFVRDGLLNLAQKSPKLVNNPFKMNRGSLQPRMASDDSLKDRNVNENSS